MVRRGFPATSDVEERAVLIGPRVAWLGVAYKAALSATLRASRVVHIEEQSDDRGVHAEVRGSRSVAPTSPRTSSERTPRAARVPSPR
jgi:hypothetical protein